MASSVTPSLSLCVTLGVQTQRGGVHPSPPQQARSTEYRRHVNSNFALTFSSVLFYSLAQPWRRSTAPLEAVNEPSLTALFNAFVCVHCIRHWGNPEWGWKKWARKLPLLGNQHIPVDTGNKWAITYDSRVHSTAHYTHSVDCERTTREWIGATKDTLQQKGDASMDYVDNPVRGNYPLSAVQQTVMWAQQVWVK